MYIEPRKYQVEKAKEGFAILKDRGYVYIAGKPRSGKTYVAILMAEMSDKVHNVLVATTKNAIPGWELFMDGRKAQFDIVNYEQTGKIVGNRILLKVNPSKYQLIIVDESHKIGVLGTPTVRVRIVGAISKELPHIHLSGTAIVESPNSIYSQMNISKFSPFPYRTFYDFFRVYGEPYFVKAAGRDIAQYDRYKPELLKEINKFTVYMTQEDAGISKDMQAQDVVHYVELDKETRAFYNQLQKNQLIQWGDITIVCDSEMKLRTTLHMIESGTCKIDDEYILLGNTEKIDYIKHHFGDYKAVGIMCHWKGERKLLERHFKEARIYSSKAHAEGVDLSDLQYFVILSSDYSGASFIQRRERIINVNGSNTLQVHHILVKKAISEQVYKTTSKKQDFNNSTYERTSI